ncbi:hypothetical protein GGTG_01414 [Gaeumannomyces tritici R3-111a-1]|uniref:Uncharacterized protein n=1 Tax=Gaeumannomyces tritici (strain R3-111a-1) TaxID=644352 RepID=J3NJI2_GAET3|nr:hypothetical protein GGTG_01414 [Gaeumannomyces tritici R3-111a-1]EJT81434.1 hypothetical protein GGTG_01414 [Gaeumannomyces tritici R3-111a-1]
MGQGLGARGQAQNQNQDFGAKEAGCSSVARARSRTPPTTNVGSVNRDPGKRDREGITRSGSIRVHNRAGSVRAKTTADAGLTDLLGPATRRQVVAAYLAAGWMATLGSAAAQSPKDRTTVSALDHGGLWPGNQSHTHSHLTHHPWPLIPRPPHLMRIM